MKKKSKNPLPLPNMNLFASVSYETWTKLTTLAATVGIGRLELYALALTWAINQNEFVVHMVNYKHGKHKKARS